VNQIVFSKFSGESNLIVYEEWERKVNQIVFSFDFKDREILKLVVLDFEGCALFCWKKYQKDMF